MKSIIIKNRDELELNELLAFTIGQLYPFYSYKKHSHFDFNLYRFPPVFNWRYEVRAMAIYSELIECVEAFSGNYKWSVVKYNRNSYSIRADIISQIIREFGEDKLEAVLRSKSEYYPALLLEDIKPLCNHIITHFDIITRPLSEVINEHIGEKRDRNVFFKSKEELGVNELLIYTIGKLGRFRFVNLKVFIEEDIYEKPPAFAWRFTNYEDSDYDELIQCIDSFQGELKWIMYKFKYGKNYIISPLRLYEIRERVSVIEVSNTLRREHYELPYQAVKDIRPLCEHIENWFNLKDKEPYYMKEIRESD